MNIIDMEISKINPGKSEDEIINDPTYQHIFRSVSEHGLYHPIMINIDGLVIDGAHRLIAMKQIGHETVPTVTLTPQQVNFWWAAMLLNKENGCGGIEPINEFLQDLAGIGRLTGIGHGIGELNQYTYNPDELPDLTVEMYLTKACNYSCPYCYWPIKPSEHPEIDINDVLTVFTGLSRKRRVNVWFVGGEPTIHPSFPEICQALSPIVKKIIVTSNGSCGPDFLMKCLPMDQSEIRLSYHPSGTDIKTFVFTMGELIHSGYNVTAVAVKYPPEEERINEFAKTMNKWFPNNYHLLDCWDINTNSFFPECDLNKWPGEIERPENWANPSGQMCRTGVDFITIMMHEEGQIARCVSAKPLFGNVWPNVVLNENPTPCPIDPDYPCPCTDMYQYWITSSGQCAAEHLESSDIIS